MLISDVLQNKRILVADDNSTLRFLVHEYLEDLGSIVSQAENGRRALEIAKDNDFDVIITDIKMPEMDGIEFLRNIPQERKPSVRIMMSGEASIEDVVSGFRQEIDEFIIKPVSSMEIIRHTIEKQLEKKRLEKELEFRNSVMQHYNRILQFLISTTDPEMLFDYIYKSLKEFLPVHRVELLLFDLNRTNLNLKFLLPDNQPKVSGRILFNESGFEYFFRNHGGRFLIEDIAEFIQKRDCPFIRNAYDAGMKGVICLPMTVGRQIYGFINFYSALKGALNEAHEEILKGIVPKISVSFERAVYQGRLFEENTFLKSSLNRLSNQLLAQQEALVFSLAELAEKRDSETGNHLSRIKYSTELLASKYLAGKHEYEVSFGRVSAPRLVELIAKSSPLHDIGKVGIPDAVLLKPEKLNAEEFEIIKTHTTIGADCLSQAAARVTQTDFLDISKEIALHHHERWDGTGYPHGIAGEQIPLSARIVAVTDVYDALRSPRIYKKPWSHADTIEYISSEKGKHFDPGIVDIFLQHQHDIDEIYNRFSS